MKKRKIYKIASVGVLFLLLPFISGLLLYKFNVIGPYPTIVKMVLIGIGAVYWSFIAPLYKSYAIRKIKTKEEYFIWKKLSVNLLLIWPDSFIGNKWEFWNDEKRYYYDLKCDELGVK